MMEEPYRTDIVTTPDVQTQVSTPQISEPQIRMKFCKYCGGRIPEDAVLCTLCGRQVEELHSASASQPQIVIHNDNNNVNTNTIQAVGVNGRAKSKWVSLVLCLLLGFLGGHKFYEGKMGMGILYLLTAGLFGIGVIVDLIVLLFKPNPYYV